MTSEKEMSAYTVGELRPLNTTIQIADYSPDWPTLFECEAQRIRTALGNNIVQLEHVGSTSVPTLAAKPCIDIVLSVRDSSDELSYVPLLESAGYSLRIREPNWHEHRMFKGGDVDVNLHVFSAGCSEIARMTAFRDWL
ncbi:MAG: GrpB family protein, partial [Parvularcula sp.]|nr:GrpB family protein [Parvularcula sp.]